MLNIRSWARRFAGLWAPRKTQPIRRQHRARLALELLEDRLVPSTLVVSTTADSGAGSLRAAVTQANADSAAGTSDTINFTGLASGSTVTLSSGTLSLTAGTGSVTIDGSGSDVTIDGGGSASIFTVAAGATVLFNELDLTDGLTPTYSGGPTTTNFTCSFASGVTTITVTSTTGLATGYDLSGPGIAAGTTITGVTTGHGHGATDSITISQPTTASETSVSLTAQEVGGSAQYDVSDTSSISDGGAINNSGVITVTSCVFFNNAVSGDGGGIYNAAAATAYVNLSAFGILQNGYTSLTTDAYPKFDANYGTGASSQGGAIYNAGTMTVDNSSLLGNFMTSTLGAGDGAAIANASTGTMTLANSTIADGTAAGESGALSVGGGIYNDGAMTVNSSTIYGNRVYFTGNRAHGEGSGIYNDASGALTITNSTIANNNGGIANLAGGTVVLNDSIVFGNLHVIGAIEETDLDGSFSGSNNLIGDIALNTAGDATGITDDSSGNQVGADGASPDYTPTLNPFLLPIGYYVGTTPTMPVISASSNPSPAVINSETSAATGGPVTTLAAAVNSGATSLTLTDGAVIANSPGGTYALEIGGAALNVAYSSSNTFTIVGSYTGATIAAGTSVYLADYQNGEPRISSGTTDIGAAEYFNFDFTGQPPALVPLNGNFNVTLAATDESGAGLPNVSIELTLDGNAEANLNGPVLGTTDSSGNLTFSGLSVDTVGTTYALSATVITVSSLGASQNTSGTGSSGSIPSSSTAITQVSNTFTVATGPGTLTFTTEPPTSITAGSSFSPVISLVDETGTAVAGDVVSLTISSGTLIGTATATTDSSGDLTFSGLSVDLAGTYTLTATAAATDTMGTTVGTSSSFVIVAGPVANTGLTFTTGPSNVIAGNTINPAVTVKAEDQYGNLVSGQAVSLSIAPSVAFSGGGPVTTNAAGLAVFSNLSLTTTGTYTLTATAGSASVNSNSFVVTPAAEKLSFITGPASTTAGSTLSATTVQIADIYGNLVPNVAATIAISPGTLSSGTLSVTTNSSGDAVFSNLVEDVANTYSLNATASGATGAASSSFVISAGAPAKLSYVSEPSSTTAGSTISPVTVLVVDAYNNPVPSDAISISAAPNALTSGTTPLTSNSSGEVVFNNLVETIAGTYTLTASSSGVSNVLSNSFKIGAAAPASVTFVTQPTNTTAGSVFSPITIQVEDTYGNPDIGTSVSIGIAPGTLSTGSTPITTNSQGESVFSALTEDLAGTYSLTAQVSGVAAVGSNSFTISAGAAAKITYVSQPSSASAGSVISPVTVQVVDQYGNAVNGDGVSISIAPGSLSAGTSPITTNGSGQSVFSDLVEDIVGTYTLTASVSGVTGVKSNSFIITPAAASALSFITQPVANVMAGSTFTSITVQAVDQFNNVVPGVVISIGISAGTLNTGTTPLTTNSVGRVVFSSLSETVAGTYSLIASANSVSSANSNSFIVTPAQVKLTYLSEPTNTSAGSTISPVTVQLADQYGNIVSGVAISIATSTGKLTSGTTPLTTGLTGQVVFGDLIEDTVGTYALTAAATGYATAVSSTFVVSTAAPSILIFITQPSNVVAGSTISPVTVQLTDQFGNLISSYAVGIGISAGTLTSGTTTMVTNTAGRVVFSNLIEDIAGTYTLTASSSGVTNASSNSFIVSPAVSTAKLSYVSQPSGTTAGTVINPVTVQLADEYGNGVPNVAIGIGISTGALSTGTTPLTSNAAGQVVFGDLSENVAGTYSLIASSAGRTSIYSSSFIITPAIATARLAFVTQPNSTTAGTVLLPVSVLVADQYGNTIPNISVSIGLSTGTLSTGATPVLSGSTGRAVFTTLSETVAGTYSLTASASGLTNVSSANFTISAGAAAVLTYLSEPNSTGAGVVLNPVTIQVADKYGNLVKGASVSVGMTNSTFTTGATPTTSSATGQAVFSSLTKTTLGTYTMTASVTGVAAVLSSPFVITAGLPAKLTYESEPASTTAGAIIKPITIEVTDKYGNLVAGDAVSIAITPGSLTAGTTPLTSGSTGLVVFNDLSETATGTYTLVASTAGVTSVNSTSFIISPAGAVRLVFDDQPSNSTAGSYLNSISVQAFDQYGNNAVAVPVTMHLSAGTLTGVISVSTNTSGIAIFNNLDVTTVGTYSLIASATNVGTATSNAFSVGAGAKAKTVFVNQPTTTLAGNAIAPVTVMVEDLYGNGVPNVAISAGVTTGKLTSGTTLQTTNSAGQVVFSDLVESSVGTFTLFASVSGLTTVDSSAFSVTAGAANGIVFVTQPTSGPAGSSLGAVTVKAVDSLGNAVANEPISLGVAGAALAGTTTATSNSLGEAVFSNLTIATGGAYTLTATMQGASAASNPFAETLTSDAMQFTTEPSSTPEGGTMSPVVVTLTDPNGVNLPGVKIAVAMLGGSLGGTLTATTNTSGEAIFSDLIPGSTGTFTMTATATDIPTADSTPVTITAAQAAKVSFLTQPASGVAGVTLTTVTVRVVDSMGNVVLGAPVSLALAAGTLSGTTTVTTNASGLAVFTGLSTTHGGTESLTASSGSISATSSSFFINGTTPTSISFVSSPSSTTAGSTLSPVTALVEDQYGNAVSGATVSLVTNVTGAVYGSTSLATNTAGEAVFTNLYITKAGTYTLSGSVSSVAAKATTGAFVISPQLSSARILFVTEPASVKLGTDLNAVTVEVIDEYGNLVANDTVTVKLSSGTLSGTTGGITNTSGEVTFSNLLVGARGTFTLIVTAAGVSTSATSSSFTVS